MTRNRNVADVQSNGISAVPPSTAGKNAVINGGFDIWQRGTSFSIPNGTPTYTADRFQATRFATGSSVSRQATSDTTNLPFIQYCLRLGRDSGNTNTSTMYLTYSMETADAIRLAGKTITFSYYARKGANYSESGSNITFNLNTGTGTNENVNAGYTGAAYVINANTTLTTTWQRISYTATIPSNATELGFYFSYAASGTAGANDYFEITGIQLEVGSTATPFSRNASTIQGELAACQRYYQRIGETLYGIIRGGTGNSGQGDYFSMTNLTTMRTSPTATKIGTWATLNCAQPTIQSADARTFSLSAAIQTSSGVQYYYHSDSGKYIELSAEL